MARPTHFEIPVDDPDRAEKFYGDVFGWSFQRFEGAPSYYGMANTGPDEKGGINGALFARGDVDVVSLTMEVDSIEDTLGVITQNGGQLVQGKMPIPGMGYFATCKDTEGNLFGLFTSDESATVG
jgi:predicted enzyme related to lactoylglutathione lyase